MILNCLYAKFLTNFHILDVFSQVYIVCADINAIVCDLCMLAAQMKRLAILLSSITNGRTHMHLQPTKEKWKQPER